MNKKDRMYKQIEAHGQKLLKVFPNAIEKNPVDLCKKLHRLENRAHRLATDYCNGDNGVTTDNWQEKCAPILESLDAILRFSSEGIPVFLNGDARGYALKIRDEYVRDHSLDIHRDWGGYGIIAPEFDGN